MPWNSRPSDRFYLLILRTGQFLRWTFRIRVITSGRENLPAPGPRNGASRAVTPGSGAIIAITHFGYLDFAFAEVDVWKHARADAVHDPPRGRGPLACGPGHPRHRERGGGLHIPHGGLRCGGGKVAGR